MSTFNIQSVSPGIWYLIHSMALKAKTLREKEQYRKFIEYLSKYFPCEHCRIHLETYLKMMPIRKSYKDLFRWSWQLHHSVNILLNKPIVGYDEALYLYSTVYCEKCQPTVDILEPIVNDDSIKSKSTVMDKFYNLV